MGVKLRAWVVAAVALTALSSAAADDGQWPRAGGDFASTRYSPLAQITSANVGTLRLVWSATFGERRGQEGTPLVVGDTMYVVGPYPNVLYAFDLARGGALRWRYEPHPDSAAQGVACCDVVNRGPAYGDGLVVFNTLDAHTVAVDARTGRETWKTRLGDVTRGESMTMAPLIVRDRVLVGNSGGEMGVRGWLAALELRTGRIAWRAWSTGSDRDVLIGPGFRPFYAADRGHDLGTSSWPPQAWTTGGGAVEGWISYDPALDLLYHGTGQPAPANPGQRPGDNKWTATIFARRPATGEAVWAYQTSPHDQYGHGSTSELVLVDLDLGGRRRAVLLHPDANGYVYVMDRATGEVLSATPFVPVTASRGVQASSGRLQYDARKSLDAGRVGRHVCPGAAGAKSRQPAAWSPRTGWLYIPHQNLCMDVEPSEVSYIAGTPYLGTDARMYAGPGGGERGALTAWDPVAGKAAWTRAERFPVWSGVLATAGDVVFYGTMDRQFKAVHARTGELLWRAEAASSIVGPPITYRGPDGRQYVAVLSGVGGWAGSIVSADLDARDASAGRGFAGAMRDLPRHTGKGGTLYVFALP
jgi:PQQ-dependent dehydrogenase (methanol/ethanol family)